MNMEKMLETAENIFYDQWLPVENDARIINTLYRLLMASGLSGDEVAAIELKGAKRAIDGLKELDLDASHIENGIERLTRRF